MKSLNWLGTFTFLLRRQFSDSSCNPLLGLELTGNTEDNGRIPDHSRNVIYSYDLGQAMADRSLRSQPCQRGRISIRDPLRPTVSKLEDAVHYHDHMAGELDR
ncbi:hypothetical protein CQ13_38335 [Bradyrhizobium retamae]|uniref:Uncharacterized protein n=1 Tax=Bradyrhizobium retamae TaxID=1300035 RepID=A0A0R3NHI0_9BRAD|nr:hypothetical protein CQ13_38335 [Bradyrhizobium retamae]